MQLVIKMADVKGWPRMYVENLIHNAGDGVRIQNWAMERRKDFKALCDEHAHATEMAIQAVKEHRTCKVHTLRNMMAEIFSRPKDEYQPPEPHTVNNTKELRANALKFIKGYVINDSKQVYTNGADLVPLSRVEHMLDMMQSGDFTYKEG